MKTTKYITIALLSSSLFTGCVKMPDIGKMMEEREQKELQQQKYNQELAIWIQNGYTEEDMKKWAYYDLGKFSDAKVFIDEGYSSRDAGRILRALQSLENIKEWKKLPSITTIDRIIQWYQAKITDIEVARSWIEYGINDPKEVQNWLRVVSTSSQIDEWKAIGITTFDEIEQWKSIGSPSDIQAWFDVGINHINAIKEWIQEAKSPVQAKGWIEFGFSPSQAKDYHYDTLKSDMKKYKIFKKELLVWIDFGETDLSVIYFFKQRGLKTSQIKGKEIVSYFNNMSFSKFMKLMGVNDKRIRSWYYYHWKYRTNYHRISKILRQEYGMFQ